jgi:integrase
VPRYKKDKKRSIEVDEVKKMIDKAWSDQHKVCVALLYLTGARPKEIIQLVRDDFIILENELRIKIKTLKGGFDRMLIFDRNTTPFINDIIIPFIEGLKENKRIFDFGKGNNTVRIRQIVYKLSDNIVTPYMFRHNRLYKLAELGASPYELMEFKGSKTMDSVRPYVTGSGQTMLKFKDKIK